MRLLVQGPVYSLITEEMRCDINPLPYPINPLPPCRLSPPFVTEETRCDNSRPLAPLSTPPPLVYSLQIHLTDLFIFSQHTFISSNDLPTSFHHLLLPLDHEVSSYRPFVSTKYHTIIHLNPNILIISLTITYYKYSSRLVSRYGLF